MKIIKEYFRKLRWIRKLNMLLCKPWMPWVTVIRNQEDLEKFFVVNQYKLPTYTVLKGCTLKIRYPILVQYMTIIDGVTITYYKPWPCWLQEADTRLIWGEGDLKISSSLTETEVQWKK